MVCFQTPGEHHRADHADYWKIPATSEYLHNAQLRSIIDSAGGERHYPIATVATRLFQLAKRTQRRLRCYDGDSGKELKDFVRQRGLAAATHVKKRELIEVLEAADEDATFARFLDLPPELRTLIYEFHFASYSSDRRLGAIQSAVPPPITHISSQIRRETLQLFYTTSDFQFDFERVDAQFLKIETESTNINRHLPQELFPIIRNFRVHVREFVYWGAGRYGPVEHAVCSVYFPTGSAKLSVQVLHGVHDRKKMMSSADPREEEVRRFFAEDFLRVWPPTLTIKIADTLIALTNLR
ncbi:unnamed protein product [Zymoseptoria tritici ST99CH_1A5]|uniref:Uncharacterized protein n=1 Tax=Zymoseptoria tritici ST99CH_1A5 TaxID=1276529 RepID=A0A1Y6LY99_ZYMTR|nr:unnamed protein product [Zymoseptoria tritici ST99CH_1A5]